MRFYIGLDLGKLRSATAVCVVEREELVVGRDALTMALATERWLGLTYAGRLPAGTGYLEGVEEVNRLVKSSQVTGPCELVVDASGVGEVVVEVLRQRTRARVKAVRIKSSGAAAEKGTEASVTRAELVDVLALEAERGTLRTAGAKGEREKLREELARLNREKQPGEEGDDLAMALALAVWSGRKGWVAERGRGPYQRVGKTEEEMGLDLVRGLGEKRGSLAWWL